MSKPRITVGANLDSYDIGSVTGTDVRSQIRRTVGMKGRGDL